MSVLCGESVVRGSWSSVGGVKGKAASGLGIAVLGPLSL